MTVTFCYYKTYFYILYKLNFFSEQEKTWNGPFYFVQGADIQFGLIQRELEKNPVPGWEKEKVLAELAVEKLNKMNPKPKFFVICGDLCDAFAGKIIFVNIFITLLNCVK